MSWRQSFVFFNRYVTILRDRKAIQKSFNHLAEVASREQISYVDEQDLWRKIHKDLPVVSRSATDSGAVGNRLRLINLGLPRVSTALLAAAVIAGIIWQQNSGTHSDSLTVTAAYRGIKGESAPTLGLSDIWLRGTVIRNSGQILPLIGATSAVVGESLVFSLEASSRIPFTPYAVDLEVTTPDGSKAIIAAGALVGSPSQIIMGRSGVRAFVPEVSGRHLITAYAYSGDEAKLDKSERQQVKLNTLEFQVRDAK